jgi:nicotinamidase-related amidase
MPSVKPKASPTPTATGPEAERGACDQRSPVEDRRSFGPSTAHRWVQEAGGLNLLRQPLPPKPVQFDAQPQCITIDLHRSVLVVVDMQNDFCHPQGWFGQKGIDVAPMRRAIAPLKRLLPIWRAAGGTVLWLNWGVRPDRLNLPPLVQYTGRRSAEGVGYAETSPQDRGRALVPGEWGAQVVDELPVLPGDITVYKHRLSGFFDNELDSVLRLRGATTLLLGGVNTDRCVFSTLQDAGFHGYDAVLLADACSTPSPAYVTRAIHFLVQQLHGFVARTPALKAGLHRAMAEAATPPAPATEPEPHPTHP